jgi:hypothetical protein
MNVSQSTDAVADLIVKRAEERYAADRRAVMVDTDRLFSKLLVAEWVVGIFVALVVSPYTWAGKTKVVNLHVWVASLLGAAIISLPLIMVHLRSGSVATRHVVVAGQALLTALLIHLTGGRIETHFLVFGSLAIMAFYQDWTVLLTAATITALDHLVRGILWPESVYGIVNPEWWRFLEHGFWVAFCVFFMTISCQRGVRRAREMAEGGAMLEALSEGEWRQKSVMERAGIDQLEPE